MEIAREKPKIYVESSTISYLTARPSRDIILNAKQELTREWWDLRDRFELFISETVIEEIAAGDLDAAQSRLQIVQDVKVLALDERIKRLTSALLLSGAVPGRSELDAYHIAFAVVWEMDFLVTWNQKHIANPMRRRLIEDVVIANHLKPPIILTPENLLHKET